MVIFYSCIEIARFTETGNPAFPGYRINVAWKESDRKRELAVGCFELIFNANQAPFDSDTCEKIIFPTGEGYCLVICTEKIIRIMEIQ
jgi:hypothetical protein